MTSPLVHACWERPRPFAADDECCMDCIVEETDRRAGARQAISVHDVELRRDAHLVVIVRACCAHRDWQQREISEAVTDVVAIEEAS